MFKRFFLKPIAAVLIFTFSYSQLLYAADVRQMLLDAKAYFQEEDTRRLDGGMSPSELETAQSQAQSEIQTQEALQDLQETNFSLTTQNGDILQYVGNTLKRIQRPDGTVLSNIELDADGNVQGADLKLEDGSIQVFRNGEVLAYETPDGTQVFYEQGKIQKTISKEGLETTYTYLADQTVLENTQVKAIYDSNAKLVSILQKETGALTEFQEGILSRITKADGTQTLFQQVAYGQDIKLVFHQAIDPQGQISYEAPQDFPFEYLLYRQDRTLKEVLTPEQNKFFFDETGRLTRVEDSHQNLITLDLHESSLSNFLGLTLVQDDLSSVYDAQGSLSSIVLNDLTIHYREGQIDWIEKGDGTALENLTFEESGNIQNARITTPDGEVRVYENAKLISTKQASQDQLFYFDDKIIKMITSEGITYQFSYMPDKIEATIDSSFVPQDSLTPVKFEYDQNLNLKKMIRQNQEVLNYLDNNLLSIEFPEDAPQIFNYTKDAEGNVLSYTVTQGNTESFYDANNNLLKVVIHSTEDNPHTLEVIYKYGKIREIFKDDILTFKYAYSFDTVPGFNLAPSEEITTIEDLEEKALKIYKDGLLLTSLQTETQVLSTYFYDPQKRVQKVELTRFGKVLHTYTYAYEGESARVTDEEGVVRTYDADKKLLFLEKGDSKYAYSYHDGLNGQEITREILVEKTLSDGSLIHYENGQLLKIDHRPDGSIISDIVLGASGAFDRVTIAFPDQRKVIFSGSQILEEILPDGAHLFFQDNQIQKALTPEGREYLYSYEKDSQGAVTVIWLKVNGVDLKYSPTGDLLGLKLTGVLAPAEVLSAATHAYQGGSNGPYSYDGNFGSAQTGGRTTLVSEHTFQTAQQIEEFTYKFTANSYSSGDTDNGSDARTYIETKNATTGAWTKVPGTYLGQSHTNSGGGGSTAYADAVQTTKKVTVSNVIAVRAVAYAGAFSNGGGSTGGTTAIWEIQLKLNDQSYLLFSKTTQDLKFQGQKGTMSFDLQGNLLPGYSQILSTQAQSLKSIIDDIVLIPYKDKTIPNLPQGHSSWVDVLKNEALSPSLVLSQEYSSDGVLEVQRRADQTITLFENNKPSKILDEKGEVLTEYTYDAEGNLSCVNLKHARDTLPGEVLKARLKIEEQRAFALKNLSIQKNLAYQSIEAQSITQKNLLNIQLGDVQSQYDSISSLQVHGSAAQNQKAQSLSQIESALNQIINTLITVSTNEANAYEALDLEVRALSDKIEADSTNAFTQLDLQEKELKKEILRQETSPVVYDYYRRILGRDPNSQEYDAWISKVDYDNPGFVFVDEMGQIQKGGSLAMDGDDDDARIPDSPDWDFGTGDFTFDFWFKPNVFTSGKTYELFQGDGGNFRLFRAYDNKLKIRIEGTTRIFDVWTPAAGSWYHIAFVRKGGNVSLFINGTKLGITQSATANVQWGGRLSIADGTNCFIEEFRVSKGIGRWTQNFTPSSQRAAVDSYTKLLLRSDFSNGGVFRDFGPSNHVIDLDDGAHLDDTQYKTLGTFVVMIPKPKELTLALKSHLESLPEILERRAYVQAIKDRVAQKINEYLSMNDAGRLSFAESLGLVQNDLVPLSQADAQKILTWINSRSLHFGQSAFLSLEALLDQKGISYAREDIAEKAILIDILSGIITPLDDGDLVISVFSLNKVASLYGLTLSAANLTWEDLLAIYQSSPLAKIIAHVNGNHFVVITGITQDTITYMDPGAGPDKNNQIETISKASFLKGWKGNVTAASALLNPVITASAQKPVPTARLLTQDETQKIRGAFFFFLIPLFISFAASIGGAVASVIAAIGTILAGVGTLVAGALSSIGGFLATVAQGIGYIGSAIWQGISFAASSLFGALGNVGSFLSQNVFGSLAKAGFGNALFENVVRTGLNFAITKGLDGLGVNPVVTNLISSFVSGGTIGGFNAGFTAQSFIQSGIKALAVEGTQTLLQKVGLDANLSSTLSFASGQFVNGFLEGNLAGQFVKIGQSLGINLARYGIEKLGTSLGLDSRIASAIASPISASFGIGLQAGQDFGKNIIKGIQDGIVAGVTGYGITFAANQIAPGSALASALLSRTFTGLIDGVLNPNISMFQGAFNALSESLGNLAKSTASSEFSQLVQQKGLAAALQQNATAVFSRDAIEQIVQAGGIAQILNGNARFTEISFSGGALIPVKEVNFGTTTLYYSALNDQNLYGRKIGNRFERGYFGYDAQGSFGLRSGEVEIDLGGGVKVQVAVNNYQAQGYELRVNGQSVLLSYAQNNQYELGPNLTIENGVLESKVTGARIVFRDGQAQEIFIPGPDNNPLQLSRPLPELSNQGLSNLMTYIAVSNGINNTMPSGQLPLAMESLAWAIEQTGGDSSKVIMPLPTFEGSPGGNEGIVSGAAAWFRDVVFGTNEVTNDILDTMYQAFAANPDLQTSGGTMVLYSGSGNPGLKANDTANFNIKSVVMIGAPTLKFDIKNPNTNTILNIFGANDAYLGSFGGQFYSDHTLNQFNVMIQGVGHTDYFVDPDVVKEVAKLISIANNPGGLQERLTDPNIPWYSQDPVTGIYSLDPDKLPDNNQ